jgi:hypothetical protein
MRKGIRAAVVTVAAVLSFAALPASGAFALTSTAARSAIIHLQNYKNCTLVFANKTLWHGQWIKGGLPPATIAPGTIGTFGSESNGFMTGTEGQVMYNLENCADPAYNNAWLKIYWDNPYIGANSWSTTTVGPLVGINNDWLIGENAEMDVWYWLNPY